MISTTYNVYNFYIVSVALEFSVGERMDIAFGKLLEKFLYEFQQRYPHNPKFDTVKLWCIYYCRYNELDEADFNDVSVPVENIFHKIAALKYCNVLTLGLLEYLADLSNNECLKTSIKNYNRTFYNTDVLKDQVSTTSVSAVNRIRKRVRFKVRRSYTRMFAKVTGRRVMTYSQTKKFSNTFAHRIICIHPRSTMLFCYGEGCVYLGWQIPSCLVEAAYHAACTNTALFAQLGIKYVIIGQYKIEPPTTCVRGTYVCNYIQIISILGISRLIHLC